MKQIQQHELKSQIILNHQKNTANYFNYANNAKLVSLQKLTPWEFQEISKTPQKKGRQFLNQTTQGTQVDKKQKKKLVYHTIQKKCNNKRKSKTLITKQLSITKIDDLQLEILRTKRNQQDEFFSYFKRKGSDILDKSKGNIIRKSILRLPEIQTNIKNLQLSLFGQKCNENISMSKTKIYNSQAETKKVTPTVLSGQIAPITFQQQYMKGTSKDCLYNYLNTKKKDVISKIFQQIRIRNKVL